MSNDDHRPLDPDRDPQLRQLEEAAEDADEHLRDALLQDRNPWDRLPGEPSHCYAAFVLYRELPPTDRKGREVVRAYGRQHPDASPLPLNTVMKWMMRYRWKDRVTAWDDSLDKVRQEAIRTEIQRASRVHLGAARASLAKYQEFLEEFDARQIGPREAPAWLKTAIEMERLVLGASTTNVASESDDEAAAFHRWLDDHPEAAAELERIAGDAVTEIEGGDPQDEPVEGEPE